ncbi:MAG TPA: hypothetical protein VE713_19635 [Pyrinomonadaceae bacterium]|jgi:hypothetical protein|nr:hypothetical protein [Pyrinomonadaceae bacterium]
MKRKSVCAALALALVALCVGTASAKVKTRKLTFGSDFWLGETLVKKGTYNVSYDDKTSEITVADKQATVARASVRAEAREGSTAVWDVTLAPKGDGLALTRLAFPGDRQALIVGEASASNSKNGKDSSASSQQ